MQPHSWLYATIPTTCTPAPAPAPAPHPVHPTALLPPDTQVSEEAHQRDTASLQGMVAQLQTQADALRADTRRAQSLYEQEITSHAEHIKRLQEAEAEAGQREEKLRWGAARPGPGLLCCDAL